MKCLGTYNHKKMQLCIKTCMHQLLCTWKIEQTGVILKNHQWEKLTTRQVQVRIVKQQTVGLKLTQSAAVQDILDATDLLSVLDKEVVGEDCAQTTSKCGTVHGLLTDKETQKQQELQSKFILSAASMPLEM